MLNVNDEEDLFPSVPSSNLASLFGGATAESTQTDLKYTAPRQPRPNNDFDSREAKTDDARPASVLCAKVVFANKFVGDVCTPVGKLGLAAVGSGGSAREFLLYRDKQNIVAKATVGPNFVLHEDDGELRFTDVGGVSWTVRFLNDRDRAEFVKEVTSRDVLVVKSEQKSRPAVPDKPIHRREAEERDGEDAEIRADILSRMARMGQSVLPKDNNGDEGEVTSQAEKPRNPKSVPRTYQKQYSNSQTPDETGGQIQPYIQTYQPSQMLDNHEFRMFVTESRTQNTELRVNMCSISTKLDTVLCELSKLKLSPNTDRLENEFLKSKIYDLEQELQSRAKDTSDAQELKRKAAENESLSKAKEDEIKQLEVTNRNLQTSLNDVRKKLADLERSQKNEEDLQKEKDRLAAQLKENTAKCTSIEKKYLELQDLHEKLTTENKTLRESNAKLSSDLDKENNKENVDVNAVKEVMNQMFQNVLGDFDGTSCANYKEIRNALSKHMKQATFSILSMLEKH